MFTVRINKLKVRTKIGVSIQERRKKQLLLVSLKFSYKVNKNQNIDNINNLISYTDIKKSLKTYIESSRCRTLEKLIIECSQMLRKRFKIQNVSIEIEKSDVAKKYGCQSISVSQ
ncbi:MAG TPA: dihydroneopterin aldolase [Pelagibacterales bacterium]|nr:dihydroneopterin aldolase [Pelagibacterales bacterium]